MNTLEKAYDNFLAIETEEDLKKNKLTLEDFDELHRVLLDIIDKGYAFTIMKNVKKWTKRNGIPTVKETEWGKPWGRRGWLMYHS